MLKRYQIFLLILLSYVTVIAFYPILSAGFSKLDDSAMILENPYIRDLSLSNIKTIFTEIYFKLYHPIVTVSYAVEYHFFQLDPYIYHLDNILLHLFNTILVLFIFRKLTKSFAISYIVALLFAIHPVHVEVVAWATARKDLLYSFFYLLSILFYIKTYDGKHYKKLITVSILCFLLSCLCKPMAITLPVILILIDYYQDKLDIKKIKIYIPFMLISLFFSWLAIFGHYSATEKAGSTLFIRVIDILNAHYNILFYIEKFIYPVKLSCLYPNFYNHCNMPPFFILYAPALLYLILFAVILTLKNNKKIFFGVCFFIITLLPSSGIMPTGVAPVADRYAYLSYIGLFYILAEVSLLLYNRLFKIKKILGFVAVCLVVVLFFLTYNRTMLWTNSEKLMTDTINNFPETAEHAYINRGIIYKLNNQLQQASEDLEKSLSINSNNGYTVFHLGHLAQINKDYQKAKMYYSLIPEGDYNYIASVNNIALMLYDEQKVEKAINLLEKTLNNKNHIIPDYFYYTLAVCYFNIDNLDKSLDNLHLAIKTNPNDEKYYLSMMEIYIKKNNFNKLEETAGKGLKNVQNNIAIMNVLGKEYFLRADYNKAEQIFLSSINVRPNNHLGCFMLGNISALKHDYQKSIKYYTTAISLYDQESEYYFKRSAVYLMLNNYELAKQDMEKSIEKGFNVYEEFKNELEKLRIQGEKK